MSSQSQLFPGRNKGPGLKSPNKLWWAKEITPDIHIAGRLTMRQIRCAEDGGFRSILSLFTYDGEGEFGDDVLPATKEISDLLKDTSRLHFEPILDKPQSAAWSVKEAVGNLEVIMNRLDKDKLPVLVFSDSGRSAAFVVLMYLAKKTREDPGFEAKIDSDRFYRIAAAMGMDFTSGAYKKVVSEMTGEPLIDHPPLPDANLKTWTTFWLAHPVYNNWFTAGQLTRSTIKMVESAGFPVVINCRSGKTLDGKPNQEEVTLVNVSENTGTYGKEERKLRQSTERLLETRIDPGKPSEYVSPRSDTNYESRNENEFGDDVGYNEELEREYFRDYKNIEYTHLPVVSAEPLSKALYEKYREKMLALGEKGPVLVHCAKARRAGLLTILAAAEQYSKDLEWALRKSWELGYGVSKETNPVVYETYVSVLGTDSSDGSRD